MTTQQAAASGLSRRRVVGAGLGGAALALGADRIAAAQTTPTPPLAPTGTDRDLLTFAMSVELAARDLYREALSAGAEVGDPNLFDVIANNHEQYATVLAGELGRSAGDARDQALYDDWSAQFDTNDLATLGQDAYDFENVLVATHTELIGVLVGLHAAEIIASIVTVEARHCAVLADVAGVADNLDVVFVNNTSPRSLPAATEGSP